MIRISNLYYDYKLKTGQLVPALKNVNLEIKSGEFVTLIGHNGSGKSTLARHLNCLLAPAKGDVWIKDINTKDHSKIWDIRRTVGMVFQNPENQLVTSIVEEEIAFGPENLNLPTEEIRLRIDMALKAVEIEDLRMSSVDTLSGGQKQKVAIASILAMLPECIILDEPTTMLDPHGRREVREIVKRLNKIENITIIYITHFMEEAVESDRVIVMSEGKIVDDGTPQEIFSQVKKLKSLSLDVPLVTELAYELKQKGLDISSDILTIDDMIGELKNKKTSDKNRP